MFSKKILWLSEGGAFTKNVYILSCIFYSFHKKCMKYIHNISECQFYVMIMGFETSNNHIQSSKSILFLCSTKEGSRCSNTSV